MFQLYISIRLNGLHILPFFFTRKLFMTMFTDINVVFYFVFFLLGADFCLIHFGCKKPGKFQKAAKDSDKYKKIVCLATKWRDLTIVTCSQGEVSRKFLELHESNSQDLESAGYHQQCLSRLSNVSNFKR